MWVFPYLGLWCAFLGVDSLRGGLAKGNGIQNFVCDSGWDDFFQITWQRLSDQSQAGLLQGENDTYPTLWAHRRTLPQEVQLFVQPFVTS